MSRELVNMVTVAAAAGTVAVEPIVHTMGVIFMGAFGGAIFALMNQSTMGLMSGLRFVIARWLLSQFCAWPAMILIQKAVGGDGDFNVPQTVMLLFVSFVVACPREFMHELEPLQAVILRLLPRAKE